MRRSSSDTTWLAADCVTPLAWAAWEKLRWRATSQNTFRDSNCMGLSLSWINLISTVYIMNHANLMAKGQGCG